MTVKRLFINLMLAGTAASLFAYNPPAGGEQLFKFTNPGMLSCGSSASGGPMNDVLPASISFNPALTAQEQRSVIDLNASLLLDADSSDGSTESGFGFEAGLLIPTKYVVFSTSLQGLFCENPALDLGRTLFIHSGLAKDIDERLSVGLNFYSGFYFSASNDFAIGADLGVLYRMDDIAFLRSPRLGIAVLNLGKPAGSSDYANGIYGTGTSAYPGIITPAVSFAAGLFDYRDFSGAFSADLSFPSFQNAIFGAKLAFGWKDIVRLTFSWDANLREIIEFQKASNVGIGLSVKFSISSTSDKIKESWKKSEIVPSVAWQQLNGGIQDVSLGAALYLGMEDKEPPAIILWNEVLSDSEENN